MKQNIPFKAILVTMMLTLSAVVMAQTNNDDDVEVVYATDSLKQDSVTWSKELDGVEVVHQKRLVKMEVDKMTYKVSEDEDSKSYTVLDMLRKVPMVTVDGQDNITVNGSSSFKVYVDGMPNVMFSSNPSMIFKSMPASVVKSIEVMTNPGAKYDAEGAAGILNIVMNKQDAQGAQSMNGYNGTVRATAGNRQLGGSVFLSGQQGKLSYSANVMTSYNTPGNTTTETEQLQDSGISQLLTSENSIKTPFTMGSLTLGYQLDSVSALNLTAQVNNMRIKTNGTSSTTLLSPYTTDPFSYTSTTDMKNTRTSFNGSLDYQRFFNKARTQSLVLTYQLSYSPATTEMTNNFNNTSNYIDLTNRYSENKDKTISHIFQLDYTMPLGTGQTLGLGGKFQLHDATADSKYYLTGVYDPKVRSEGWFALRVHLARRRIPLRLWTGLQHQLRLTGPHCQPAVYAGRRQQFRSDLQYAYLASRYQLSESLRRQDQPHRTNLRQPRP